MNKQIIISFILMSFFFLEVNAQIGNYCQNIFSSNICYEFKEDKRFEFKNLMCVGVEVGHGKFEIEKGVIRFFYEPIEFFENQFTIKKVKTEQDSIKITFKIKDYDTGEVLNDYLILQEKKGQYIKEFSPHSNNIAMQYSQEPILINVSSEGYSNYTFKIEEGGQYEVVLSLKEGFEMDIYEIKDRVEEFTIIEMTKEKIRMKPMNYEYVLELILEE